MKDIRYYQISEPALRDLLTAAFSYWALQKGGVKHWEGFGEAMHYFIEESSNIDCVDYKNMKEIVEASITNYSICNCDRSSLETFLECLEDFSCDKN